MTRLQFRLVGALALAVGLGAGVSVDAAVVLIAEYDFESTGNLGLDSSGNGNNGAAGAGVSQVAGVVAGTSAAHFSGVSGGAITVGSALSGGYTGPDISYSAWVKLDSTAAGVYNTVVSQGTGATNRLIVDPTQRPFIDVYQHADYAFPSTVPLGQWFHLTLTAEQSGATMVAKVYVNGIQISGSPPAYPVGNPSALLTYVGADAALYHFMHGAMDDVRIYQGALSAAEVAGLLPQWTADSPGNWSDGTKWSGGVPNTVDAMANFFGAITAPSTVTVDAPITVGTINFSNANKYTIDATGGNKLTVDVSTGSASIVVADGSHEISAPLVLNDNAVVNVMPAASTLTLTGNITGGGGLTKTGAGTLTTNSTGWFYVGTTASDIGAVTVNAGILNVQNPYFIMGGNEGGTAQFTQNGGTVNYTGGGGVYLANGSGASQMTLSGGAFNQTGGGFHIGVRNNATLNVSGSAVLTIPNNMIIGWGADGQTLTGTLNLNGGTINQTGGFFALSNNYNGAGQYLQTAGAYNFTGTGGSYIANYGTGQMTVSGGSFTQSAGTMNLGWRGPGTLEVSGTGSVTVPSIAFGGLGGSGTVNLNGGTLTVGSLSRPAGTGTVNFNGGVLRAAGTSAAFMQGLTAANVKASGAKIDTQAYDVTVAQPLVDGGGGGGLTKLGNGTLTLAGNNSYAGATVVSQGTLRLAGGARLPPAWPPGTLLTPASPRISAAP